MSSAHPPRSRKETRSAVLEALLREKRMYRQDIAADCELSEASVSRILTELRQEGIVVEEKVPSPYVGGPGSMVALSKSISVLGIELSNERLSVGISDLGGAADYIDRRPAPIGLDQSGFEALFREALKAAADWAAARGRPVRQAVVSIPGLRSAPGGETDDRNVIFPWSMTRLRLFLAGCLGELPFSLLNTIIGHAAWFRYRGQPRIEGDHLLVMAGNGVAGVVVREGAAVDAFSPYELGHMVVQRGGALCRCGHHGCVEAYSSLRTVSRIAGLAGPEILRRGDGFLAGLELGAGQQAELRQALRILGAGIGNALTLTRVPGVVVCGWPALMDGAAQAEVLAGIDEALLGGIGDLRVLFTAPAIGTDPLPALAAAAHAFVRAGGPVRDFTLAAPEFAS